MLVIVDGTEQTVQVAAEDFFALMEQVVKQCNQKGRVVTRLELNGKVYQEAAEMPADVAVDDQSRLVIETSSLHDTAVQIVHGAIHHMNALIDGFTNTAGEITAGNHSNAMVELEKSLTLWMELNGGVLQALSVLGVSLDQLTIFEEGTADNATADQVLTQINQLLEETQRAFEQDDLDEIGDILNFEIPPLVQALQHCLQLRFGQS